MRALLSVVACCLVVMGCASPASPPAGPAQSPAPAAELTSSPAPAAERAQSTAAARVASPAAANVASPAVGSPVSPVAGIAASPVARASVTVVGTLRPEATATPEVIRVGPTNDQAVYLYNSPTTGDRIRAYPEGTRLLVVGGDVEGDGLTWHFVQAPDGTEGYIPVGDTVSPDEP